MQNRNLNRPADIQLRKELGRAYFGANKVEEALETYLDLLADYPEDVESYVILGDYFLAEGRADTALQLYTIAQRQSPDEPTLAQRVQLAQMELGASCKNQMTGNINAIVENPQDVIHSLKRLIGYSKPVTESALKKASDLLTTALNSPHPAKVISEHLPEIEALLPAMIEMNIIRAKAEGRFDLATSLRQLLEALPVRQTGTLSNFLEGNQGANDEQKAGYPSRVLVLHSSSTDISPRLSLVAEALIGLGVDVNVTQSLPADETKQHDAVLAQAPQMDFKVLEELATWSAKGIPIIVDLEADYEQMPVTHPQYETYGLGTLAKAKSYTTLLLLADVICVPSPSLGATLLSAGYSVKVIPDGWSKQNTMWDKPTTKRHTIHLGWMRDPGQLEDIAMIRRVLLRVLREFTHTCLVIVDDPRAYQLFDRVPEPQKLFLPLVNVEDYPYLLGQIDILLVPSRNTPYNRSCSDKRYMEAGIRCIPWIGSPLPASINWGVGGLIANTLDEWYIHLRQLIQDRELRIGLGHNGRKQAEEREIGQLAQMWGDLIRTCMIHKRNGHHKQ